MLSHSAKLTYIDRHRMSADKFPRKNPSVLIIDDDIDSALAVESIFRNFGCDIAFALDPFEAQRKISSATADIIILDWLLDPQISADQVVNKAVRVIEKFAAPRYKSHLIKPKIVTYSSLDRSLVELPQSPFYDHWDHWQKPLNRPELTKRTIALLNRMDF